VREGVLLHHDGCVKGDEGERTPFPIATVVDMSNPAEAERVNELRRLYCEYLDSSSKAQEGFSQQMMKTLQEHNFFRPVADVSGDNMATRKEEQNELPKIDAA
jgi:hypothetical protein